MSEDWSVERLVPGGDGLCRLADGRIGFVGETAPGDRVRVTRVDDKKRFVRALEWEVISSGPERVEPVCPYARECGGCDFMHLSDLAQLAAKEDVLRQALRRTARMSELPEPIEVEASPQTLGYRSRLRIHLDRGGRVGLYARGSHRVVDIERCLVSDARVNQGLAALRSAVAAHPSAAAHFPEVEIRSAETDPEIVFVFRSRPGVDAGRGDGSRLLEALAPHPCVVIDEDSAPVPNAEQRHLLPGDVTLHVDPLAFVQVNWAVNARLVQDLCRGVQARGVKRFLDLYAGAGNFALPLLRMGLSGVAVEREGAAIRSGMRAASAQGLDPKTFRGGDVGRVLPRLHEHGMRFDLAIVDPPRKGAGNIVREIAALGVHWVACIGCDPVTLARDLEAFGRLGYQVESVRGFDMFPHTHHFETLAWLERVPGG